jgi:hypothetical protein
MVTLAMALVIIITMSQSGAPPSSSGSPGSTEVLVSGGGLSFGGADETPHTGGLSRMFSARGIMYSQRWGCSGAAVSGALLAEGGVVSGGLWVRAAKGHILDGDGCGREGSRPRREERRCDRRHRRQDSYVVAAERGSISASAS